MQAEFCQLWLTCKDHEEASKIAQVLLKKRLVACVKQVPAWSAYRWEGKIEKTEEVILIMDSRVGLFDTVEEEISKLHSYDTFVLQALPLIKLSKKAAVWLSREMHLASRSNT